MGEIYPMGMSLDEFFAGFALSRPLFEVIDAAVVDLGNVERRVTKSQIAFRRRTGFAWVWIPGRYLAGRGAPLVLSLALSRRDTSPRWKESVEPKPGRFMHHLELCSLDDIDEEVRGWLQEAWTEAA